MNARTLGLVSFAGLRLLAFGQYEPDTIAPLPLVCDVFVLPGMRSESMYAIGLEQWRTLAPGSELLSRDLSDHKQGGYYGRELMISELLAVSASFRLGGNGRIERSGVYLRGGFAFSQQFGNDLFLSKETRTRFDTLTSAQTGAMILLDSVTTSTYYMEHQYSQLALDASVIFLKEYPKRWSLYGGAGAQIGVAFAGRTGIGHTVARSIDPRIPQSGGSGSGGRRYDSEREEFRTKDDLTFALYAPLGVTYRLGKKRAFWRALNLCYEVRPSLLLGGIPELDPGARVAVGQYFGLRVDLLQ